MATDAAGELAPSAGAGKVGGARKLGRWLTRWWFRAPDGRTYQRRWADALVVVAGLSVVVVCGVLVANRLVVGTDVAVFRRINHWPGWLYPPMWTVQLSGVIGALPLVAAAAALLRRLRLAAALAVATLLKVSLEAVAKTFVQHGRPAEAVPDVILRGKAAAHGLSFPLRSRHGDLCDGRSGGPLLQEPVEDTALGPGRRGLPVACVSRGALSLGRRRGGGSGHVHRGRAEPCVRRAQRQLQHCPRQRITVSSRARFVETAWMLLSCQHARTRTFCNLVSLTSTGTAVPGLWRLAAATSLKTAIQVRPRRAMDSCTGLEKLGVELNP
jgi:hypothetical protein